MEEAVWVPDFLTHNIEKGVAGAELAIDEVVGQKMLFTSFLY
jgi:hypothetical protein